MSFEVEIREWTEGKNWNSLVLENPFTTIYHSSEYARMMKKSFGLKPLFFILKENGKQVGGALVFEKTAIRIPVLSKFSKLYFSYAPPFANLDNSKEDEAAVKFLIKKITEYGKNNFIASINLWTTPYWNEPSVFEENSFKEKKLQNVVLDLRKSLDEIKKEIKKEAKKNVKKAEASGLVVREGNDSDLQEFYKHYESHHKELGLLIFPFDYFKLIFEFIIQEKKGEFFVAEKEGKFAAGIMVSTFNNRLYEMAVASNVEFMDLRPNDLLKMNVVEFGHENGFDVFDLSNIAVEGNEKQMGVNRFKLKWGNVVSYNEYKKTAFLRGFLWKLLGR